MHRNRRLLTKRVSVEELWSTLAARSDASAITSAKGRLEGVRFTREGCVVELGTRTVNTGQANVTFTRVASRFHGPEKVRFKVLRRNVFHRIAEVFGKEDLRVGRSDFDQAFTVRASDPGQVRSLLMRSETLDCLAKHRNWILSLDTASKKRRNEHGPDLVELKVERTGVEREQEVVEAMVDLVFLLYGDLERLGVVRSGVAA